MCSGTELILAAVSILWQVSPRSDNADRPAPEGQNLGVGLLVTVLAHLPCHHVAKSRAAIRLDSIRFAFSCFFVFVPKFDAGRWFFLIGSAVPDGGLAVSHHSDPRILRSA